MSFASTSGGPMLQHPGGSSNNSNATSLHSHGYVDDSASAAAAADLVLLQQNLIKSRQVTTRMANLLTGFDDRLARLDRSVVPIHRSTKDLSKIQRNVEAVLLSIDSIVGTNDLIDREQDVLERDPKDDLLAYQASISRLRSALKSMEKSSGGNANDATGKGKEREGTVGRVRDLIERGCHNLGNLFLDTVQDVSPKPGWTDITQWDQNSTVVFPTLMPESTITYLVTLLGFLKSVVGDGSQLEQDLQQGYGEIRGMFMAATLNTVGREAIDPIESQARSAGASSAQGNGVVVAGRLPAIGRGGFGRFLDATFAMAKSEHALAGRVFDKAQANQVYSFIINPALTIFTGVGTQINNVIKTTLTSNPASVGIAFTCYEELTLPKRTEVFEDWIRSKSGGRKENDLAQLSHIFRASCLRSLPEFVEEIQAFGTRSAGTAKDQINRTGVAYITVNTVAFVKQLCEFPETVESFLATLGDGNWMPAGGKLGGGGLRPGQRAVQDDGSGLFSRYLVDVLQALLAALDARARTIAGAASRSNASSNSAHHGPSSLLRKDGPGGLSSSTTSASLPSAARQSAGYAAIFMLNNIAYLRREILMNSSVPDFLEGSGANRRDSGSTTATGGGGGGQPTTSSDTSIEDELNKRNRSSKTSYLEIFSPLVSCLMDAGMAEHSTSVLKNAIGVGGNTEKKDTKDRFVRFNEALEEIEGIHRNAKLDRTYNDSPEFRARLKDEVVRMCVPTYTAFVRKHDNFSKNPSKYLKIDPAGLQSRLESLFD